MMDKSQIATEDWIVGEVKYLADCFNTKNTQARSLEFVKQMKNLPKYQAKKIFREFIEVGEKFPLVKNIIERVNCYKSQSHDEFKKLEEKRKAKPKYETSLTNEMMISARPMKLMMKKDRKKFNKIKAVFDEYFPNTLTQATDENSAIDNKDLRVNSCFSMLDDFYKNPIQVFKEEIEKHTPGVLKDRYQKGLEICQSSKDFFTNIAKSA
ncbi:MAG: hypothetical protein COB02_12340 [Candidatus Cloacimonadota bacterium]|nr:MAG: hypothetical protein COB02_12340 [Candidatus Cloacimonadota bacterium]